jgi:hypothetical protein
MTRCPDCGRLFPLHDSPYVCKSCTAQRLESRRRAREAEQAAANDAMWRCLVHDRPLPLPNRAAAIAHAKECQAFADSTEGRYLDAMPDGVFKPVKHGPGRPNNMSVELGRPGPGEWRRR